ncbi:MAG: peptidylprolyl isomerase [Pseudomonadota bacterium]
MPNLKSLFAVLAAAFIALPVFAADPENILVIEVAGETSGTIEIELLPEVAPKHVERVKRLARDGIYDGIVFHRVIDEFMAQTGDVQHGKREGFNLRYAGTGKSVFPNLPAEFSDIPYVKGTVGMARSQETDSGNSQFFIMFEDGGTVNGKYRSWGEVLNGQYTVFGKVIAGQDVVDSIKRGSSAANGAVAEPDYMETVRVKADVDG